MTREQHDTIAAGLSPDSSPAQRVRALLALKLTLSEISSTFGVSEATVRGWQTERHPPSRDAARALDDLRFVVKILWDHQIPPDRQVNWLRSGTEQLATTDLPRQRPLEAIGAQPVPVMAAAQEYATATRRLAVVPRAGDARAPGA